MTVSIDASQVRQVLEILNTDSYGSDATFRPDYSGRFMYGSTCAGFVHERGKEFKLALALGQVLADAVYDLRDPSGDSMGMQSITYFQDMVFDDSAGAWEDEDSYED